MTIQSKLATAIAAVFVVLCFHVTPALAANRLTIEVDGLRSDKGRLICAVYNSSRGFKTSDAKYAYAAFQVPAKLGRLQVTFHDLPKGAYAFVVFHDENSNDELDTTFMGMPKEGYAYSNNAGKTETPGFRQARFFHGGQSDTRARTRMIYWK